MDFCLKGSQINLATRQNTKVKYTKVSLALRTTGPHFRPRSANFTRQRSFTSPFLSRPQSADPKIGRDLSIYFAVKESPQLKKSPIPNSQSSTDLLKSLLEEPVKRSWIARSAGNSSTDEHSDFGIPQKSSSYTSLTKRTRIESVIGSSVVGVQYKHLMHKTRLVNKMSCSSTYINDKCTGFAHKEDYWTTMTSQTSTAKPDLPGRVSFSKKTSSTMLENDFDSSDCDNDKQLLPVSAHDATISAPGPLIMSNYKPDSGQKKSVHFGATAKSVDDDDGDIGILAETYEYPKCPSENCTCSTRSSSTESTHEAGSNADIKCACNAPTCRFGIDAARSSMTTNKGTTKLSSYAVTKDAQGATKLPPYIDTNIVLEACTLDGLEVIREYKHAVGEQLENTVVKNLLEVTSTSITKNVEVPSYLEKYAVTSKASKENIETKQNNLSETKFKPQPKHNLGKSEQNLMPEISTVDKEIYATSSADTVINNYLKVSSSTSPLIAKKKENNKPGSTDMARQIPECKPRIQPLTQNAVTSNTSAKVSPINGKLKKTKSISSLSEVSKLSEYNLDKVDTWMSVNERKMTEGGGVTQKSMGSLIENMTNLGKECYDENLNGDDSVSQYSLKSDDNSQDSTYNEIVSVIKEIEEDKKRDNFAECMPSELDLKLDSRSDAADTLSHCEGENIKESFDKYKDMLAYLDNVENSCDKSLLDTRRSIPDSNRTEIEFIVEPDITEDVPKLPDLLMLPNHQLARRVIALSLRANELANAIHLSKEHIIQIRTDRQKLLRAEKGAAATKLRDQKKHYEEVVQRHQGFIEQLLKDKGSLCEKVAALTRRLESQNQAWEHRLETEIMRVKETGLAGEKIRRERWVRENTKKIKELTVKGLEAEINKMNCEHQREITELKRSHQQQLLDALEEARLKHEQIETSIRESCAQDRESIIEKERTAIRERYERQLEEEQNAHDEQKQKLCEEFANERERLLQDLRQKDLDYQAKRLEMQRDHENELEQVKFELQEKMAKQEEKYQNRINTIEKQYLADFELWKREYENSCKLAQAEKENSIRQHYRTERDRQLDELVIRMEAEALQINEEHEQKISRLKEKYEKDLMDAENVEKSLREKYAETRTKLAESDAQVRNFQAELKQLQMELEHSKKMCNDLLNERDQLRQRDRNEILNELVTLKKDHNAEIETLHKRVQQTIGKKEVQIERLESDNGNLRERCLKLEAVIRQQRKDYCVK